jgi:ATP-dependent exoDNAse (exonuclease V) beta subunit
MWADGAWLRGTIDCIVRDESGMFTVLEFKTGRPRREHAAQVELYRRAAEHLFAGHLVKARLVYASESSAGIPPGW